MLALILFCLISSNLFEILSAKLVAEFPSISPFGAGDPSVSDHFSRRRLYAARNSHQQRLQHSQRARDLQSKVKRPPSFFSHKKNGGPLSVKLGMYLESLGDFRETQMSFEVDLYMYMSWRDPTLQHPGPEALMINDDAVRRQLWLPDLYFANARQANFHEVTVPNFNLFISPDGTVAYSSRVTLTVACNLKLDDYPMDLQQCHIRVLSYAYIAKMVNVTWFRHSPIMHNAEIDLPEFEIQRLGAEYCDGTYRYAVTERSYKTDRFSCLTGNLYLRRRIGFNMVQSYIPTGLIVIISWVSFWIDRRAVPARVTLSFTTLLTMTTIGNGMRYALPRVSYAKAIDYWFGGCMIFVFMALVEFALVNSYMRRSDKYERLANKYKRRKSADELALSPIFASELARSYAEMLRMRRKSGAASLIDGMQKYLHLNSNSPEMSRRKSSLWGSKDRLNSPAPSSEDTSEAKDPAGKATRKRSGTREERQKQSGDGRAIPEEETPMNGSYYENMQAMVVPRRDENQNNVGVPNGTAKKSPKAAKKASSVQFAMGDKEEGEDEPKKAAPLADENYLWPDPSSAANDVKADPQLSVKYLETSQLLSRRALAIDKVSRVLFPLAFIAFNLLYWGYYLILRRTGTAGI